MPHNISRHVIDSQLSELLNREASNGFIALVVQYDLASASAADGKINGQDANQDGPSTSSGQALSQASELTTLAQQGIASINLAATQTNTALGNGNTQTWTGSFTRTDGSTGTAGAADLVGSLDLAANNFYREFTDNPMITAQALALPQMRGSGKRYKSRSCLHLYLFNLKGKCQSIHARKHKKCIRSSSNHQRDGKFTSAQLRGAPD